MNPKTSNGPKRINDHKNQGKYQKLMISSATTTNAPVRK